MRSRSLRSGICLRGHLHVRYVVPDLESSRTFPTVLLHSKLVPVGTEVLADRGVPWAKADENRCAWPADLKRCMPRSRLRGGRMDAAARVIRDVQVRLDNVDVRLGAVEERVRPGAAITDMQATEVSSQVKVLAGLLTGKNASKNHYQAFFAELYRRFSVSSYKLIPQAKFQAVLAFLDDWRTSASTSS